MADEPAVKFLCDDQLGKLARWLRIIGQDVFYKNRLDDQELMDVAAKESRLILTRDLRLAKVLEDKKLPHYLVMENYPAHQLKEVAAKFQDRIKIRVFSRCTECNLILEPVEKAAVADLIPPFVFKTQDRFRQCPNCKKVFWAATHRAHVEEQLAHLLGDLYFSLKEEVW
jgi:uncharacterized protein